jgi:hypothetical protein
MSPFGPQAKSGDVRFCAAVGGEADIDQARRFMSNSLTRVMNIVGTKSLMAALAR